MAPGERVMLQGGGVPLGWGGWQEGMAALQTPPAWFHGLGLWLAIVSATRLVKGWEMKGEEKYGSGAMERWNDMKKKVTEEKRDDKVH